MEWLEIRNFEDLTLGDIEGAVIESSLCKNRKSQYLSGQIILEWLINAAR